MVNGVEIGIAIFGIITFLVIAYAAREVVCWYFKINRRIEL